MERSLHQFLTVAETGSISAASKQLNVTQPTITVNIRNLEQKHNVALFERTPRGMVLTTYGSILFEKARMIHRLENQAVQEIEARKGGAQRIISIGCGDAWWSLFVRGAIDDMALGQDNEKVYVENGSNLYCMWKLLSGDILVSVGHRIDNLAPGINAQFKSLFSTKDAYYVADGHPLLDKDCTTDDLVEFPWIHTIPLGPAFSNILTNRDISLYEIQNCPDDRPVYSSNSLHTCIDMIRRTNGCTILPYDMAGDLSGYGLTPLDLDDGFESKEVGIYYLSEREREPQIVRLLAAISAAAERYVASR